MGFFRIFQDRRATEQSQELVRSAQPSSLERRKILGNDDIRVVVKSPKTRNPGGDAVMLFKFPRKEMCPVTIFQEYAEEARKKGLWNENLPIFRNEDGSSWAK
jgi:hypothetical protein